jgi:hypothetical protein
MVPVNMKMTDLSQNPIDCSRRTVQSAIKDFSMLAGEIDELLVYVFSSKQIRDGFDVQRIHSDTGMTFRSSRPAWKSAYGIRSDRKGLIEINADEFLSSSKIERKFVARHEMGHIVLSGPPTDVKIELGLIDCDLRPIYGRHLNWVLEMWKEFKVNSLIMELSPQLTIRYMNENPKGFSRQNDERMLRQYQTGFENLLVSVKLEVTGEMQLRILEKAPMSARKRLWKSVESLHSDRVQHLKRHAFQIRPELRQIEPWFSESCLEDKESLVRRIIELITPNQRSVHDEV